MLIDSEVANRFRRGGWLLPDVRRVHWAAAGALGLLTLLALLPLDPQGPFDARDFSRLPGIRVEQTDWTVLAEPFVAPIRIILGAPDMRVAGKSMLIWVILAAGFVGLYRHGRRSPGSSVASAALSFVAWAVSAGMITVLWLAALIFLRVPGWRLTVADPDVVIVDFQSHTFASHDGGASLSTSLDVHKAAGFDVVAVTEHQKTAGPFSPPARAVAAREQGTPVIPGLEVRSRQSSYLLALGFDPGTRTLKAPKRSKRDYTGRFASLIHSQQGAVLASTCDMPIDEIARLADAGVDGFEIVTQGHSDITPPLRQAILQEARSHSLVLVASSDWHGWGEISRTWTAVHMPGASALSPREKTDRVMRKLRHRDVADFVPVVTGYIGPPSGWRVVFSPFVELARYAMELSPAQVLAWWLWAGGLAAIARALAGRGWRPGRVLLAAGLAVIGAGLIAGGWETARSKLADLSPGLFPLKLGIAEILCGAGALAISAWLVYRGRRDSVRVRSG